MENGVWPSEDENDAEEEKDAPFFLFPSDFGGDNDIPSLIDRIDTKKDAKVLNTNQSHGTVYKHGGNTLVGNYFYWEGKGERVNVTTPMLIMLQGGLYCLRRWKPAAGSKKNWYVWIVCDVVTQLPIDSADLLSDIKTSPAAHLLLAAWNKYAGMDGETKTYALRYVRMNGVVMDSEKAPPGWVDIFGVSPSGQAPTCIRVGCTNAVPPYNSIYWDSICASCKRKEKNARAAADRLTPEGQAKEFASNANGDDKEKGVVDRYSTKRFLAHILPLTKAAFDLFGKDTILSKERLNVSRDPTKNSYTQNAEDGTLIVVPFRFNMGGQSTRAYSDGGVTSKTWSLSFFVLCSCAQSISKMGESVKKKYDISCLFDPLSKREYRKAKSKAMCNMTGHAKTREDGSRDATIFGDLQRKYGYVDTVSGFLQLTYELNNKGGTARISPYVAIEEMIKENAAPEFGPGSVEFGSPIHQLTKFSPDRLDNKNTAYTLSNTVSVAGAFQTAQDQDTDDPVLKAKKTAQKWQPSVFAATDFCDMSKVYRFIPDEEEQTEKYDSVVKSVLKGLRKMVAKKRESEAVSSRVGKKRQRSD